MPFHYLACHETGDVFAEREREFLKWDSIKGVRQKTHVNLFFPLVIRFYNNSRVLLTIPPHFIFKS